MVLWSSATLGGTDLRDWQNWTSEDETTVATEVRTAAYEIIKNKGVTNHAIGLVTATLVKWLLRGDRRILTVSRVQEGMLGYQDLAISLPTIVSIDGAETVLEPNLDATEKAALDRSAEIIKKAIASINL